MFCVQFFMLACWFLGTAMFCLFLSPFASFVYDHDDQSFAYANDSLSQLVANLDSGFVTGVLPPLTFCVYVVLVVKLVHQVGPAIFIINS